MTPFSYGLPSLLRNPRRTAAYLIGTVLAVGLISSVLLFVAASASDMTQRTIAPVKVDLQAIVTDPHAGTAGIQQTLTHRPEIATSQQFTLSGFRGAQVRGGNHIGQTASGKIMAVNPGYFPTFRAPVIRQGSFTSGGAVISLDMGTNLGARVGDMLTLTFPSPVPPVHIPITGIATMQNTDVLFAPIDPVQRANPFQPPANVVMVDLRWFNAKLKPALLTVGTTNSAGSFVQRGNGSVIEQVHVRLRRDLIPSDPTQAKTYVTKVRRALEAALTGRVTILDNITASLDQAQSDVLWAQAIFIFLALPGVVLAAALSRYVTATAIDAQRRELALLRIRGVGPRQLLMLLGSTLFLVSLFAVIIGIGAGWLTTRLASGAISANAGDPLIVRTIILSLVAGLVLGMVSTLWPLLDVMRAPIVDVRRRVGRGRKPLWERLYLDFVSLIIAVVVYEILQRSGGFRPVLNAEGNPTISLSIFTFVAPLLFWIGAILLLVRISRRLTQTSGRVLGRLWRGGVVGDLAARTIERRSGALHQAVLLVAMAVAFSSGLLIFVHTYNTQQRVDAELTLGSDVKVSAVNRAQSGAVARKLAVPGVQAFTPFRSTLAYVGAEVQDMFGIDLRTFANASKVSEAFFVGSTAAETLHRLSTTPNGLIVSQETAQGFSLNLGDSLILRMFNVTKHRYVPVHFKLVGVAREFATAPKDAFLVANLAYIQRYTGDPNVDLFLIRTSDSPSAVANTLRAQFANGPLVHVDDLSNVQQKLSTSLTSLNLGALTRIDLFYTFAMFIISLLVFVLAVLLERRRDFAMLQALGTTPAQIRTVLLIEVGYAVVVGSIFGLLVGVGFAELLVQILAAIFDPPPDVMAIPWSSLALAVACMVASGLLAGTIASARLGRLNLAQTLREA